MNKHFSHFVTAMSCGLAFLAVTSLGGCQQTNRKAETFIVDSKESRIVGSGEDRRSVYYVYGTKGEVYRNEDVFLNFSGASKFDSATLQAKLKPGHVYRVETIGWRIPFMSMVPNIVTAKDVTIVLPRKAVTAVELARVDDPQTDKLCREYGSMVKATGQSIPAMQALCVV